MNTTHPRSPAAIATITWKTPSWYRIVGAQTPSPVWAFATPICSSRVATEPMCSHESRSVLR